MPFPSVFLPGSIVQPQGGQGLSLRTLSLVQLTALREALGPGELRARTPDPQARRFEFKRFVRDGLRQYEEGRPLADIESLSQFRALLEGFVFGHLTMRIYDLRKFDFAVADHLRYIGVLQNKEGRAVAGTDPDLLFFSAANVSHDDFRDLEKENARTRSTDDGVRARALLRGLREKLQNRDSWQPAQILWMQLLDRLFFTEAESNPISLDDLREGWKQIGPVVLRTSTDVDRVNYLGMYLPVYEADYQRKALTALSGQVGIAPNALQLTVNGRPAGRIAMPAPQAVGGQDLVMMGAGNIEADEIGESLPICINYEQLRPSIQSVVNSFGYNNRLVQDIAQDSPFTYPDILRIPTQADGFIAIEGFRGASSGKFGERFVERFRGKKALVPPTVQDGESPPCLVDRDGNYYFVDRRETAHTFYVDSWVGERVDELSLLGFILWSIFDKRATVFPEQNTVAIGGNTVLRYTGSRYEVGPRLHCEWPNLREKAATLQRLVGALQRDIVPSPSLFRAAITRWLNRGYDQGIDAQPSTPRHIEVGPSAWMVDNY
jgi:hypothetical protein